MKVAYLGDPLGDGVVTGGLVLPGWEQDSCKWRGIGGESKKGARRPRC